jgi:hypothetical protein
MTELVADGFPLSRIAPLLQSCESDVKREWAKVKRELGPQAR